MAKGFKKEDNKVTKKGYQTIFQKLKQKSDGRPNTAWRKHLKVHGSGKRALSELNKYF